MIFMRIIIVLNNGGIYYKILSRQVSGWEDNWKETTEKPLNNIL